MPTAGENNLAHAVKNLCFPAINILRGIELDLQEHPECPYRDLAKIAVNNLLELLAVAGECTGKEPADEK
jgi:hypothetical protein